MKKYILFIISLSFTFYITGCTSTNTENELTVYTSIYPFQYITEQITGDQATIQSIYPPGVDAHTYEPTSKEITDIANGDLFIYLGANMESIAESAAGALRSQDTALLEIAEEMDGLLETTKADDEWAHMHDDNETHSDLDPHVWLDPLKMIDMAERILEELIAISPNNETFFTNNFTQFKDSMENLNEQYKSRLEHKTNKQIIVAHAAYGYWESRYDIKQIPIRGMTAGEEPSQKDLIEIVEFANENNVKSIIFEQSGSDKVAEIIRDHIDAKALYIHNLEVLTEDDIANKEDYLSLMKQNLDVLDEATS